MTEAKIYNPIELEYSPDHQSNLATHSPQKLIECLCVGASTTPPHQGAGATFLLGGADKAGSLIFAFDGNEEDSDQWSEHMGPVVDEAMSKLGQPAQWLAISLPLPDDTEMFSVAVSTGHAGVITINSMTRSMKMLAYSGTLEGLLWSLTESAAKYCWGKAWEGDSAWATAR